MANRTFIERKRDAADDKWAACGEAVQIVTDSATNFTHKVLSCLMDLAAFEIEVEAGEFHVGRLGDFDVAFGTVNDVDVVAKAFDETGFVGGVDTVGGGFGESFFQEFDMKDLRRLREDDALARNGAGDERDIL